MKKKVSIVKAFDYGIYLLRDHYWQLVWPILIFGLIESIQVVTRNYPVIPLVVNILRITFLFSIVKYMLNLAERKHCNWMSIFLDKEKYLNLFYYSLLVFIVIKLSIIINNGLNVPIIDKGLLILFFYLWIRFYFAPFFIADHGVNLVEGLKLSYEITKGFLLKMSLFMAVYILVHLTGVIIIIIGRWLFAMPLLLGVSIYMYQKMIDNSNLPGKYKSKHSIQN